MFQQFPQQQLTGRRKYLWKEEKIQLAAGHNILGFSHTTILKQILKNLKILATLFPTTFGKRSIKFIKKNTFSK